MAREKWSVEVERQGHAKASWGKDLRAPLQYTLIFCTSLQLHHQRVWARCDRWREYVLTAQHVHQIKFTCDLCSGMILE